MTDEKKNATLTNEQSNSELADANTALDNEQLSEDELDAVAGGARDNRCYPRISNGGAKMNCSRIDD